MFSKDTVISLNKTGLTAGRGEMESVFASQALGAQVQSELMDSVFPTFTV